MREKTFLVSINGAHVLRRFRTLRKAYAYLLWYSDRIASHFSYVIYTGRGIVVEKDNL